MSNILQRKSIRLLTRQSIPQYSKQMSTQHIPEVHITNNFISKCHVLINHDIVNARCLHMTQIILNSVVSSYLIQLQCCKYYFANFYYYCVTIKFLAQKVIYGLKYYS